LAYCTPGKRICFSDNTTLQQINTPAQFGVICKLTEGALSPFIQIIKIDISRESEHPKAVPANCWSHQPPMRCNKALHAKSAMYLGKNVSEIFKHEEPHKIKALNFHLGKKLSTVPSVLKGKECN